MGASMSVPKSVVIRTDAGDVTLAQTWVALFCAAQGAILCLLILVLNLAIASHTRASAPGAGFLLSQASPELGANQLGSSNSDAAPNCLPCTCPGQSQAVGDTSAPAGGQPGTGGSPYVHLQGVNASAGPLFPPGFVPFETVFVNSKSDKNIHRFGSMYAEYLDPLRLQQTAVNMLEIGLRNGVSLGLWVSAFPQGRIYGIEMNPKAQEIAQQRPKLKDRVKVFVGDQANVTLLTGVVEEVTKEVGLLDFIVDDGGHSMEQQITSFTHLMPLVKPGGVYFIEDLQTSYWSSCHYFFDRKGYCYGGGPAGKKNTTIDMIKSFIDVLNADFMEDHPQHKNEYGTGVYHVNPSDGLIGSVQCWRNMCAIRRKYKDSYL